MTAVTDADAEREIDLGRWKQAAVERWWLVAAGLVAGVVVGALLSLAGGSVYQASVLIAPGQAFSPSGAPVLNYLSSPRGINDLVTSESTLKAAQRQATISNNLAIARQQLALAQNIEYAQVIGGNANAVKTTARSRRNSILVGALIGLLVGLVVAIVADVRARRA